MTSIEFTHPSGIVELGDVEARLVGGRLQLRGIVDNTTWERMLHHDIFGAISRTRSPGDLPAGDHVRITLSTNAELPTDGTALPAELFVILDAMHQVDLSDSGLEGEVWDGIRFSAPPVWGRALTALAADGFELIVGDDQSAVFRHDDDAATVQFRHRGDVSLVQIVVSSPLPLDSAMSGALYEAVNGINVMVPWSTTMIHDGDVLVRHTVADHVVDQAEAITSAVQDMLGLLWVIRGPLAEVARGSLPPHEALGTMFGG